MAFLQKLRKPGFWRCLGRLGARKRAGRPMRRKWCSIKDKTGFETQFEGRFRGDLTAFSRTSASEKGPGVRERDFAFETSTLTILSRRQSRLELGRVFRAQSDLRHG